MLGVRADSKSMRREGKDVGVARTGAGAAKKRLARVLYRLQDARTDEYQEEVKASSDISAQAQVDDSHCQPDKASAK